MKNKALTEKLSLWLKKSEDLKKKTALNVPNKEPEGHYEVPEHPG
jgi:hypothetical protein